MSSRPIPDWPYDVDAFILAGGSSSRMGRDKALLPIAGRPMLLRMSDLVEPLVTRVAIVGPPERYARVGLAVLPDDYPGAGPLGGIVTAMRHARSPWFLILGCDLPYLTREWLAWLIGAGLDSEAAVVMPIGPAGYEPLCAMYHQRCAATLSQALARGVRKITDGLLNITMEIVPREAWQRFDPEDKLFQNVNDPELYATARADLEGREEK